MKPPKSANRRENVSPAKPAPRPKSPLVSSPAEAKREGARLRRGRESLASSAATAETDIRTSLI